MTISIRAVQAADLANVVVLVTDVLAEFGLTFGNGSATDDELRDLPQSYVARGGAFWVAALDGELVGTCGVFPVAGAPTTFELRKMYLRPATRGLGVGTQLLATAIAWSRGQGATQIVLDTVEQMTRAITFYEAHGFVRDDAQVRGARCSRGYTLAL
ncbi:MAG: GNAT family N-acetyltransferase [Deltaproteobacteria bacterium]|nr:GNAT family N-acetyltransferase [Deltaproteobacteria bacterium]